MYKKKSSIHSLCLCVFIYPVNFLWTETEINHLDKEHGMLCIGIFGGASLCNASLVHCFLVLGAIYFWCCVFGAMHCKLYRAGLLPQ